MLASITPLGERGRASRWWLTVLSFTVGALLMTDAVYDSVYHSLKRAIVHTSTFSENGLSMRAGLATLHVRVRGHSCISCLFSAINNDRNEFRQRCASFIASSPNIYPQIGCDLLIAAATAVQLVAGVADQHDQMFLDEMVDVFRLVVVKDFGRVGGLFSDQLQSPQHQLIEPVGERRRVFRQLAVEDLRLLQQQERQVLGRILVAGDRRDQGMAHVDLQDRLGGGRLVLHRQQALKHAIMRVAAGNQT